MSARLRTIAAGSALGLAAGSAAVLGAASPAAAESVTFNCTTLLGATDFQAELGATPSTVPAGGTITPDATAVMNIPEDLANAMRGLLGVGLTSGSLTAPLTVDGVAAPTEMVIAETAVPATGPIPLSARGPLAPITGTDAGDVIPILTDGPTVVMNLLKADGTPALDPQTVPCTTTTGEPVAAGKITVVKATSKSKTTAKYAKKTKKAKIVTKVTTNGVTATGKVKYVVKLGKKTIAKKAVALKNGTAKLVVKAKKKGKYKVTTSYAGNSNVTGSKSRTTFRAK